MHDRTLIKIAIVTSISGILLLYIAMEAGQPIATTPAAILEGKAGEQAFVKGRVISISRHENVTFIQLAATESAGVVLFKPTLFNITEHMNVEARGTITEHNGTKEMIAEEVRVI